MEKQSATVLIVEDDESVASYVQTVLRKNGFDVLRSEGERGCIAYYREICDQIDLVLLDFLFPTTTGLELLRMFRKVTPGMPVILSSGSIDDSDASEMHLLGLAGILPKPYSSAGLLACVIEALKPGNRSMLGLNGDPDHLS